MAEYKKKGRAREIVASLIFELREEKDKAQERVMRLERKFESQTKLQKHNYLFDEMPNSIRDPIYGNIPLSSAAFKTLDTKSFQRLKYLCQTGPALHVYPGLRHTRFEHSVGVYHLMRLALQHFVLLPDVNIEPELGVLALCAALLHDIGHFPYSHVLEEIHFDGKQLSHEEHTKYILSNDSELGKVIRDQWGLKVEDVISVLSGEKADWPRFLRRLLNSTIDLDKMDYLNRDAYHAGVPYGDVDVYWLISSFRVDPSDQDLLIVDGGIGAVEQMIFAKYLMYRNIYWHHATREATSMFKRAIVDFILEFGLSALDLSGSSEIRQLCCSTDADLLVTIRRMANSKKLPLSTEELLERLESRRLYKRVHVYYASEEPQKEMDYLRTPLRSMLIKILMLFLGTFRSMYRNSGVIFLTVWKPAYEK
jgi:HD superfamily phosphohydrolase